MLSFEERMALLNKALQEYTPESLYEKLRTYPAYGPTIVSYELPSSEGFLTLRPRHVERAVEQSLDFFSDNTELDLAA
ncbi:hypothetical protein [Citrobacter freundii]|uniref:hypothetical protein n=1 Tax=Citrobacter freundii TaxID=546 RepID=UPI00254AB300|nr:hypothetical protein [Citrobacter freundii]MDK6378380.1 hypothetical protein [Citrobacter freundii]